MGNYQMSQNGAPVESVEADDGLIECQQCQERVSQIVTVHVSSSDTEDVCESCAHSLYDCCQACGEYWPPDYTRHYCGEPLCDECYDENYFTCDGCDCVCHNDDYGSDGYCVSCDRENSDDDDDQDEGWGQGEEILGRTFRLCPSRRRYGVELETSSCPDYESLINSRWGCKPDGSIDGQEFVSPIMAGDQGFKLIDELCAFAEQHHWRVDGKCGFHLHVDVKGLGESQVKTVLAAYSLFYPTLAALVPATRRANDYCQPFGVQRPVDVCKQQMNHVACGSLMGSKGWSRYCWINPCAYQQHGTIEVRLHSGTLNPVKIKHWIILHTVFVDEFCRWTYSRILRTQKHLKDRP